MIAMAIVAVVVWWFGIPSQKASRFVQSVNEGDFELAAAMFIDSKQNQMLTEWQPRIDAKAKLQPPTINQLFSGRRTIFLNVTYRQPHGKSISGSFSLEAGRQGIYVP